MPGATSGHEQVIIQLGDLHYPEFAQLTTDVDNHDASTPGHLDSTLGLPVPRAIRQAIIAQLNEAPSAIVAVCGDITSRGDFDAYAKGLEYIADILSDPTLDARPPDQKIHIVPGNHDVNFNGDQPFVSFEDVTRFDKLSDACVGAGLGHVLATTHRESTTLLPHGGGTSVMSINTARGVGAQRRDLPGGGTDAVLAAAMNQSAGMDLADEILKTTPGAVIEEILDVPLLHPEELLAIAQKWGSLDARVVPVIVAHHGMLPQHTPRLNPYTEMANGGQARKSIAKLGRSVLYLHGHIHEHVVEIIDFPKASDTLPTHDRAVLVAAPELREGFNRVTLHFGLDGYPLGLTVEKFRIGQGEQTVSREPDAVEVSLSRKPALSQAQRRLFALIINRGAATGAELIHESDGAMSDVAVEAFVEALCWSGLIQRNSPSGIAFASRGYVA